MVVDASVIVAAMIDTGPDGAWAEAILATGELLAPDLALVESANILRRLERAKKITEIEATAALYDLMKLDLALMPFEPFAERVWELRGTVTSCDAWYVAIAEALQHPLATLDLRLSRASGPRCRFHCPK